MSNLIEMAVMILLVVICIFCLLSLILHLYYKFQYDWDRLARSTVENCKLRNEINQKSILIADLYGQIRELERINGNDYLTKELFDDIKKQFKDKV